MMPGLMQVMKLDMSAEAAWEPFSKASTSHSAERSWGDVPVLCQSGFLAGRCLYRFIAALPLLGGASSPRRSSAHVEPHPSADPPPPLFCRPPFSSVLARALAIGILLLLFPRPARAPRAASKPWRRAMSRLFPIPPNFTRRRKMVNLYTSSKLTINHMYL